MSLLFRYIPLILSFALLCLLVSRRAYKLYPVFFTYVAFGVSAGSARLLTRLLEFKIPEAYGRTYWITEAGYDILGILVMYEVFRAVFQLRKGWTHLIFPAVLAVGIFLSIGRAHALPPKVNGILLYIITGEVAVRFVQVIMFAGLVTAVLLLGLRWRQYPFGIAVGFGIYSTVGLLITTKFSDFGTAFKFLWGWTSVVSYSVAELIWIWFFSVPQKTDTPSSSMSAPSPGVLKQYIDVLRRMR